MDEEGIEMEDEKQRRHLENLSLIKSGEKKKKGARM